MSETLQSVQTKAGDEILKLFFISKKTPEFPLTKGDKVEHEVIGGTGMIQQQVEHSFITPLMCNY